MTKYTARITQVLRVGIHKMGIITEDGDPEPVVDLALPNRVEIELEEGVDGPCMMLRYAASGDFCGDTWHETLRDAFDQASFEYGLTEADFSREGA